MKLNVVSFYYKRKGSLKRQQPTCEKEDDINCSGEQDLCPRMELSPIWVAFDDLKREIDSWGPKEGKMTPK